MVICGEVRHDSLNSCSLPMPGMSCSAKLSHAAPLSSQLDKKGWHHLAGIDFDCIFFQYQTPPADVCIQSSTAWKGSRSMTVLGPDVGHPENMQQMKRLIRVPLSSLISKCRHGWNKGSVTKEEVSSLKEEARKTERKKEKKKEVLHQTTTPFVQKYFKCSRVFSPLHEAA